MLETLPHGWYAFWHSHHCPRAGDVFVWHRDDSIELAGLFDWLTMIKYPADEKI